MKSLRKLALLSISICILAGCTADTTETSQVDSKIDKQPVSAIVGKPSAPITMQYRLLTTSPKAGEEIEIEVSFDSTAATTVTSQLTSAENLTWLNREKNWHSTSSKSGEHASLPRIKVVAPQDGRYYLRFVAEVEINGEKQAKPFTIAINVGDGAVNVDSVGEVITDEKGQKLIIQKAESDN